MRFWLLCLLVGCEDSDSAPKTFSTLYADVLSPSCGFSSCHGGGAGAPFFGDEQTAYDSLVDAESSGAEGEVLVRPGDADNSYLILKLEDAEGIVGDAMPPSTSIDEERIGWLREWIDAGASRD